MRIVIDYIDNIAIIYTINANFAESCDGMETIEHYFSLVVEGIILLIECAGVFVVLLSSVKGVIGLFKKDPHIRLNLAEGIALALEFKLGGEVLRTLLVRQWSELAILGAVIALRGLLTILIHWEIKNEQKHNGAAA
jgi:uncharacterized membrane protein